MTKKGHQKGEKFCW